jgi:hypothetical protein
MKFSLLKIPAWFLVAGLSACSPFYSRHYTKGLFYEGFAHKVQAATDKEKPTQQAVMPHNAGNLKTFAQNDLPKIISAQPKELQQAAKPEKARPSMMRKFITPATSYSSPFLKKSLKPVQNRIRTSQHSDSVAGKAAFYILALILAVGIVALAIYFLPAILIPAAATSTFSAILLLGAIIVVAVFLFLIYTLIKTLIDLFKHKKEPDDTDF